MGGRPCHPLQGGLVPLIYRPCLSESLRSVDSAVAHRLLYPQVPAVLSAAYMGRTSGMPVVSCVSLSSTPPLMGVSCNPQAYTFILARRSRCFSLSFLDSKRLHSVEMLASLSGRTVRDKLAAADLAWRPGPKLGAPLIGDALAYMECSVVSARNIGDHVLLVGKIMDTWASEDFDGYWRFRDYHPILYTGWRGGMGTFRPKSVSRRKR